jgi:hypothetical protein
MFRCNESFRRTVYTSCGCCSYCSYCLPMLWFSFEDPSFPCLSKVNDDRVNSSNLLFWNS